MLCNKAARMEMRNIVTMHIGTLRDFFAPIADLMRMKLQDMNDTDEAARKVEEWLERRRKGELVGELQEEGRALEADLDEKRWKERAFEGHEDAVKLRNAADYTDEWFCDNEKGSSFRSFYVCMAGHLQWPCCTVIITSAWSRLKDDPAATGQRWYCNTCGARYATKYGVLLEFVIDYKGYYMKAPFPERDWQDVKNMAVQRRFQKATTPEELLALLPDVHPTTNEWLKAAPAYGVYCFDKTAFEQVTPLPWDHLHSIMQCIIAS